MVNKLTESERRKMLSAYNKRENANRHTENSLVLIKRFGTQKQIVEAKRRNARFQKSNQGISESDYLFFYRKGHKPHFRKLIKPIKK